MRRRRRPVALWTLGAVLGLAIPLLAMHVVRIAGTDAPEPSPAFSEWSAR